MHFSRLSTSYILHSSYPSLFDHPVDNGELIKLRCSWDQMSLSAASSLMSHYATRKKKFETETKQQVTYCIVCRPVSNQPSRYKELTTGVTKWRPCSRENVSSTWCVARAMRWTSKVSARSLRGDKLQYLHRISASHKRRQKRAPSLKWSSKIRSQVLRDVDARVKSLARPSSTCTS
jgi:hypothetical protein